MASGTVNFTGANGSAAPAPFVTNTFGGTQNIQSNQWRMVSASGYNATCLTYGTATPNDMDITVKVTLNGTKQEQYPGVGLRLNNGDGGGGWASPFGEPEDGYVLYIDSLTNQLVLAENAGGAQISASNFAKVWGAGGIYWLRFQAIGTTIRGAVWDNGGAQSGWQITITDSTWTSGRFGFRDSTNVVGCTCDWDDFSWDDLVSSGTAYTDNVTTTAVMSTANSTDSRGMTESLVTTGVSVTSQTDQLAAKDSPVTTGVGSTSAVNTLTMAEIISSTAVGSTGVVDSVAGSESVVSTAVGSTSLVDLLAMFESLSSVGVVVTSETDSIAMNEAPISIGTGVTSLPGDTLTANDAPVTTVTMLTGEVDLLAMYETPASVGVGVTSEADSLAMFEFPVTLAVGSTSESDRADFQDAVLTTGIGVTSETDVLNGTPTPGVGVTYFGSMIINKS